ncbi:hypothetical protein B1R94_16970 [Mycolicibacterium litorale]|nr:hypothetical protein B1R94_16970 [Mycolicibacterium litorale]
MSAAPAAADSCEGCDTPNVQFFKSPSGNLQCEIDFQRDGVPDGAYCMSMKPPQHVLIGPDGALKDVCTNNVSCLSNGPVGEPVLPYGQSKGIGPFVCQSEQTGMTCTANGKGFTISMAGIVPV